MKTLCIIGAGGHGKVIADIAKRINQYEKIIFLDDNNEMREKNPLVVGDIHAYKHYLNLAEFVVAIGSNATRKAVFDMLVEDGAKLISLIHPSSCVSENAYIGKGTVIMPGCVVNSGAHIEQGVILNTCSSVDHDCYIGEFSHIAVGAHLCGTVRIGEQCMIGAGSTIINNINICNGCILGAGCVVVDSIIKKGTYIGVPAKKVKG